MVPELTGQASTILFLGQGDPERPNVFPWPFKMAKQILMKWEGESYRGHHRVSQAFHRTSKAPVFCLFCFLMCDV